MVITVSLLDANQLSLTQLCRNLSKLLMNGLTNLLLTYILLKK
ncbi:MAG: hypothetical protein ACI89T_000990 [Cognaticolwellia sp.]|jgi:hypothetical protein